MNRVIFLNLVLLLVVSYPAQAGTITVKADGTGDYPTIQAAIDAPELGAASDSGRIIGWGSRVVGVDLSGGFVAVAGGTDHSLGLKEDGSIVAWGWNYDGQCDFPSPNSGFVAITAGIWHSLVLKEDGSIVAWGDNSIGQCDIPSPNSGFVDVAARGGQSLAIVSDNKPVDLIAWLLEEVRELGLSRGIKNSLMAKLEAAHGALEDENENNDAAAINTLEAFINAVKAQQHGKKIPEAEADDLIAAAQQIIDLLSSK